MMSAARRRSVSISSSFSRIVALVIWFPIALVRCEMFVSGVLSSCAMNRPAGRPMRGAPLRWRSPGPASARWPSRPVRRRSQDRLVFLLESNAFRVALDYNHADRGALRDERGPDPVHGRRSDGDDLALADEAVEDFGPMRAGAGPCAGRIRQATSERLRLRRTFLFVDEVREAEPLCRASWMAM